MFPRWYSDSPSPTFTSRSPWLLAYCRLSLGLLILLTRKCMSRDFARSSCFQEVMGIRNRDRLGVYGLYVPLCIIKKDFLYWSTNLKCKIKLNQRKCILDSFLGQTRDTVLHMPTKNRSSQGHIAVELRMALASSRRECRWRWKEWVQCTHFIYFFHQHNFRKPVVIFHRPRPRLAPPSLSACCHVFAISPPTFKKLYQFKNPANKKKNGYCSKSVWQDKKVKRDYYTESKVIFSVRLSEIWHRAFLVRRVWEFHLCDSYAQGWGNSFVRAEISFMVWSLGLMNKRLMQCIGYMHGEI